MKRTSNMDIREEVKERLVAIADKVTPQDRILAQNKFKVTHVTILRYLRGNGQNLDRGLVLLEFFHEKINERIERLKAIA